MASHPAYSAAQDLDDTAGELAVRAAGGLSLLPEGDHAEVLRLAAQVAEKLARCVSAISGAARSAATQGITGLADEAAGEIADAGSYLQEAGLQLAASRATEKAWAAGARHGREGGPPAIAARSGDPARDLQDAAYLAASLSLLAWEAREEELTWWAATSYRDAYAEAAGGAAVVPGRFVAGQQVTTALGRQGTLTGDAGIKGHPRVRFGDGTESTMPRGAIAGPLAHLAATWEEIAVAGVGGPDQAGREIAEGNVFVLQADQSKWLMTEGSAEPATAPLPDRYSSRLAAGLRLARELTAVPGPPGSPAVLGSPGPVAAVPPAAASRGSRRPRLVRVRDARLLPETAGVRALSGPGAASGGATSRDTERREA